MTRAKRSSSNQYFTRLWRMSEVDCDEPSFAQPVWSHVQARASIHTSRKELQKVRKGQGGCEKRCSRPLWLSSARYVRRRDMRKNRSFIRHPNIRSGLGCAVTSGIDLGQQRHCPIRSCVFLCIRVGTPNDHGGDILL